jgi:putative addiction module killer protein
MSSLVKILFYETSTGKSPLHSWLDKLDTNTRAIMRTRIDRIKLGNFGDVKRITNSDGVFELRIAYGPGYRIYFGKINEKTIVLLLGGNKGSQRKDIEKAKKFWIEVKDLMHE